MKNKVIAGIVGSLISLILNFAFIHHMIIPDECYYHSHRPNVVMELFYDFNANNGYHPSISSFNVISTLFLGAILGTAIKSIIHVKRNKKQRHDNPYLFL